MKVPVATLADSALAQDDGKLYITGGGITTLSFDQFPATRKRLALALSIELSRPAFDHAHELRILASGPSSPPFKTVAFQFMRRSTVTEQDFDTVNFVSSMEDVVFNAPGLYSFDVRIDDKPLAKVRLKILQREVAPTVAEPDPATEAGPLLESGYEAFAAGDIAAAEQMFRSAMKVLPTWAPPHNNLGFVLLMRGAADEALQEFEQARRFGFTQDEITEANVGCALYLAGRYESARAKFVECLQSRGMKGPSLLYGIDGDSLFIESVASAGQYSALMSINAAWSAKRAGQEVDARLYQDVAEAAAATLSLSARFVKALSSLREPTKKAVRPRKLPR